MHSLIVLSILSLSYSIPMRDSPQPALKNTTVVNNTLADNGPYPMEGGQLRNGTVDTNSTQTELPDPPFLTGQEQAAVDEYHDIVQQNREQLYDWANRYGLVEDLQQYEKTQQNQTKNVTQQKTTVTSANGTVAAGETKESSAPVAAAAGSTTLAPTDNSTTASGNSTTTTTKKPNSGWSTTVSLAILPLIIVHSL